MLQRERQTAQALCEQLRRARQYALPQELEYLDQLIRQADQIERYFREMNDFVDQMYTEFGMISHRIGEMLTDNKHWYDRFAK